MRHLVGCSCRSAGPLQQRSDQRQHDAWTVNFGYIVSDSFFLREGGTSITGATFAMWLIPGDTLTSAELSITSSENGGTSYFDQTLDFYQGSCTTNHYGYNVCNENTSFGAPLCKPAPTG